MAVTKETRELKKEVIQKLVAGGMYNAEEGVRISEGRVTVRRSYFYRFGGSAEKYAEKIQAILGEGYMAHGEDHWAVWPKTSYFVAVIGRKPVAAHAQEPLAVAV